KISRREFLKKLGQAGLAFLGAKVILEEGLSAQQSYPNLVVVKGRDAELMLEKAFNQLGGIKRFIKRGSTVVLKPNAAFAQPPKIGANTHPEVLQAMIRLCKKAGAKKILVAEHFLAPPNVALKVNGLGEVAEKEKVEFLPLEERELYRRVEIPKGKVLKSDEVAKCILEADVFINMPVAKVHGGAILTLGMKNLMGTNWDRGYWHRTDLHRCIADYSTRVKPHIIVLDAFTLMLTNGPGGPGELKQMNTLVVGTDPVAVDSYGASLFGMNGRDIPHIRYAYEYGLGQIDLKKLKIKYLTV
ncbi:MAG: DUF362 domain-containing protein, partial [bacterium]